MPVRPRRQRRLHFEWSPRMALALSIGPAPGSALPTDAAMREAWEAFGRSYLLASGSPGRRPWAWWAFEPGVPAPLRATRPELVPIEDADDARREADALEARRAAWLTEHEPAA